MRLPRVQAPNAARPAHPTPAPVVVSGAATAAPVDATLRTLLEAHYSAIWRLLRRFGVAQGRTDDAAQEVFWVAARRLDDIKAGSESAFLYGIAIRVAARFRQHREPVSADTDALESIADERPSAEELMDERRARAFLDRVLDQMDEKQREVFVLFELEELEIPEIANILAIPVGTVGSRLRRAREDFSTIAKRLKARLAFSGGTR